MRWRADRDGRGVGRSEAGHVRLHALQHSSLPDASKARRSSAAVVALAPAILYGAGWPWFKPIFELAGLQQHQPSRLCGRGVVCVELSRSARQLTDHDQSGIQHGGAFLSPGFFILGSRRLICPRSGEWQNKCLFWRPFFSLSEWRRSGFPAPTALSESFSFC